MVTLVGVGGGAVDVKLAGFDFVAALHHAAVVLGVKHGGQTKLMVVGHVKGMIQGGVGQNTQHGAKDFFLNDFHALAHASQQGGGVVVTFAVRQHATALQRGAL